MSPPDPFTFTPENDAKAKAILKRYPAGHQASAILPLLTLAQAQHGGWLPQRRTRLPGRLSGYAADPRVRGRLVLRHVQHQTGRPDPDPGVPDNAMLAVRLGQRPARRARRPLASRSASRPRTAASSCASSSAWAPAPTRRSYGSTTTSTRISTAPAPRRIIEALQRGERPKAGSQTGRQASMPVGGKTTLLEIAPQDGRRRGDGGGQRGKRVSDAQRQGPDLHQSLRRAALEPRGRAQARRLAGHQGHHPQGPGLDRRGDEAVRPARPWRRRLPDRAQMDVHAQEGRRTGLLGAQCRRKRARHLQGPRDHPPRAAQAARGMPARRRRHGRDRLLHLHPRRVRARGRGARGGDRRSIRRGPARQGCLRLRLRLRDLPAPRRRRLHLRRGDRPARKPGRQEGPAAAQAPVPRRGRPVRPPDHGQQRRDDRPGGGDPEARRRMVRGLRPAQEQRHQDLLRLGPREPALHGRGRDEHPAQGADRAPCRRRARRLEQPARSDPRRLLGAADPQADRRRRADGLRARWPRPAAGSAPPA